jgi:2-hydroxychromene-2-carboxylate isomerase
LPAAPVVPIRPAGDRRSRYLEVAVRAEAGKVADAKTNRNATLYAAAVALGQLVEGDALTEDEVRAALMTAAGRHLGTRHFTAREAETTITSGLRAGANRPRRVA